MRKILAFIMVCVMLVGALTLTSCSRVSDEEAITIAKDLIERSYHLNVAYYGEGLPYNEDAHVDGDYYTVAENAHFRQKSDLIIETKAVFSEDIANSLVSIYLDGTSSMGVVVYARYITGPDGFLTVNKEYKNVVEKVTKYDTSTLELVKNKKNEMIFNISNTEKTEQIEVVLVYEERVSSTGIRVQGWRIDSPTY